MGGYTAGRRDAVQAFAADRDLLLWLHAEAVWHREQLDDEALKWTEVAGRHAEELDEGRVAYLEARVGELKNTIGELRAENADLDDRRARWAEEHQKRLDELERSEASRRAWAEEAMRLDMASEATYCCTGAHNCPANVHIDGCFYSDEDDLRHPRHELSCGHTNAEAQRSIRHELCGPSGSPQCAVHPEGGGEIRAVPWTEADAAAFEAEQRADGGAR